MKLRFFIGFLIFFCFVFFSYGAIQIDSCQNITVSGSYIMNKSVLVNGTCFRIQTSNVLFDCNNYNVVGNGTGYGFYASSLSNITVQNCKIYNFSNGIIWSSVSDSFIKSSQIINVFSNALSISSGAYNYVQNIIVKNAYMGIDLGSPSNNFTNLYFENCSGYDIRFQYVASNNIIKNSFFNGKIYFLIGPGIYAKDNILYNNTFMNSSLITSLNWGLTPNFFNYSGVGNKYLDYNGTTPYCFGTGSCDYHPSLYILPSSGSGSKGSIFPFSRKLSEVLTLVLLFVFLGFN